MSKKAIPKRYHKKILSLTLKPIIIQRLKEQCEAHHVPVSNYIERLLESNLYSEVSYATSELRQAKLKTAYWEYQLRIAEEKQKMKQEKLTALYQ